jgi:hypothetical protein
VFGDLDSYREFEEYTGLLLDAGVLSISRELVRKDRRKKTKTTSLDVSMSLPDMVRAFVRKAAPKGERKHLREVGEMLLELTEEESL